MNSESGAQALWFALALLLPLGALMARRLPMGQILSMALGWTGLFLIAYLVFHALAPEMAQRDQTTRQGEVRLRSTTAASKGRVAGAALRVAINADGHYWVDADVNGTSLRFLVDSGANITGMSEATAARVGLTPDPMSSTMQIQTANGKITASRMTIATMNVGPIHVSDLPVAVSPHLGEINLLGMNFLSKLKSWRVEDGVMILEPR